MGGGGSCIKKMNSTTRPPLVSQTIQQLLCLFAMPYVCNPGQPTEACDGITTRQIFTPNWHNYRVVRGRFYCWVTGRECICVSYNEYMSQSDSYSSSCLALPCCVTELIRVPHCFLYWVFEFDICTQQRACSHCVQLPTFSHTGWMQIATMTHRKLVRTSLYAFRTWVLKCIMFAIYVNVHNRKIHL